ncbi:MAG: hypothetical protein J6B75_03100 [Ruminococcus sp.]|nr:hypothetical protein [Ruminococcus sp.]
MNYFTAKNILYKSKKYRQRVAAPIADRILMNGICVPVATYLRKKASNKKGVSLHPLPTVFLMNGICVPVATYLRKKASNKKGVSLHPVSR